MVINVDDKNGLSIADGAPTMIFTSLKINNVGGTLFVSFPNGLYQPSRDLLEKIFICGFNRTQNQAIELSLWPRRPASRVKKLDIDTTMRFKCFFFIFEYTQTQKSERG